MLLKKVAALTAIVSAVVPAALLARKRMKLRAVRTKLAKAKAAGRKVAHAAKPRKARRIARHLAKAKRQTA